MRCSVNRLRTKKRRTIGKYHILLCEERLIGVRPVTILVSVQGFHKVGQKFVKNGCATSEGKIGSHPKKVVFARTTLKRRASREQV